MFVCFFFLSSLAKVLGPFWEQRETRSPRKFLPSIWPGCEIADAAWAKGSASEGGRWRGFKSPSLSDLSVQNQTLPLCKLSLAKASRLAAMPQLFLEEWKLSKSAKTISQTWVLSNAVDSRVRRKDLANSLNVGSQKLYRRDGEGRGIGADLFGVFLIIL